MDQYIPRVRNKEFEMQGQMSRHSMIWLAISQIEWPYTSQIGTCNDM